MNPEESIVNAIIGQGSRVTGDLDIDGVLRIDGSVKGSIRATGMVIVGVTGRVEAPIRAKSAIISGRVKGDVYVSRDLRILAGAVVIGNIFAPVLEADIEAIVHGDIQVTGFAPTIEEELAAFIRSHGNAPRFLEKFHNIPPAPKTLAKTGS